VRIHFFTKGYSCSPHRAVMEITNLRDWGHLGLLEKNRRIASRKGAPNGSEQVGIAQANNADFKCSADERFDR
jgi:hypothetical protein